MNESLALIRSAVTAGQSALMYILQEENWPGYAEWLQTHSGEPCPVPEAELIDHLTRMVVRLERLVTIAETDISIEGMAFDILFSERET